MKYQKRESTKQELVVFNWNQKRRRHAGQYLYHLHLGTYLSSSYLYQQGEAGFSIESTNIQKQKTPPQTIKNLKVDNLSCPVHSPSAKGEQDGDAADLSLTAGRLARELSALLSVSLLPFATSGNVTPGKHLKDLVLLTAQYFTFR